MNKTKKLIYDVLHNLRNDLMVDEGMDKKSLETINKYLDYYKEKKIKIDTVEVESEIMYQNYKQW